MKKFFTAIWNLLVEMGEYRYKTTSGRRPCTVVAISRIGAACAQAVFSSVDEQRRGANIQSSSAGVSRWGRERRVQMPQQLVRA